MSLMPGYYLRRMHSNWNGSTKKEVLAKEFYPTEDAANRAKERMPADYTTARTWVDVLHVTETRKTVPMDEASLVFQVSKRTIYNWMREGKIEYVRTIGGSARILVDSLFDQ